MKFIGTSFSRCLFSLAREEVAIDSVAFIVTNTAYPNREVMIEQIRQTMMGKAVETHVANAIALWDSGRIYQPSTRPENRNIGSACWVEAPAALFAE